MTYAHFDDNYAQHPKIIGLSDGAFRLHTAGILYASRHLTDGIIQATAVPLLIPKYQRRYLTELVDRLLWVDLGKGAAYEIHDFLEWNKSKSEVDRLKESGRQAARIRWAKGATGSG